MRLACSPPLRGSQIRGFRTESNVRAILLEFEISCYFRLNQVVLVVLPIPQKTNRYIKLTLGYADSDMYLFKDGITPMWEDKNNVGGGFLRIRIDKKKTNRLW